MRPFEIIKYPISTEKAVRLMESQNKVIVVVDSRANRKMVKQAFEKLFKVEVIAVKIANVRGVKKAYIKLAPKHIALDIATELGMI